MISCQRDEFYLPDDVHYLNGAYMSPLSRSVESAGIEGIHLKRNPALTVPGDFFETSDGVRKEFAGLIGASDYRSISILPSVSYGIAIAARNLDLPAGGEIILLHEQFPSNVYTWRRLAEENDIRLRVIHPPEAGENRGARWNERILESISRRTVAICIPIVHWADGTRFDISMISRRAIEVDAAVIIDGTQSIGALPFDVGKIKPDALICAGYKWLMGPYSMGMAYWSERFDQGNPIEENWIVRHGSEDFAGLVEYEDRYQEGAIRFDVGERSNFILMPMMLAALKLVRRWGPENVQEYCCALTADALREASALGFKLEEEAFRTSHLFGIRVPPELSLDQLRDALIKRNVSVSVRGSAIRVAPNVYNDSRDIDALVETLSECMAESQSSV